MRAVDAETFDLQRPNTGNPAIDAQQQKQPGAKPFFPQKIRADAVLIVLSASVTAYSCSSVHAKVVLSTPLTAFEIVSGPEHDRLDTSFACSIGEGRPHCLTVAGSRIDQQPRLPRGIDVLPFFSQSSKRAGTLTAEPRR